MLRVAIALAALAPHLASGGASATEPLEASPRESRLPVRVQGDTLFAVVLPVPYDTWFPDFHRGSPGPGIPYLPHGDDPYLTVSAVDLKPRFTLSAFGLPRIPSDDAGLLVSSHLRIKARLCHRDNLGYDIAISAQRILEEWDAATITGEFELMRGPPVSRLRIFYPEHADESRYEFEWLEFDIGDVVKGSDGQEVYGFTLEMEETYLDHAGCILMGVESEDPPTIVLKYRPKGVLYLPVTHTD